MFFFFFLVLIFKADAFFMLTIEEDRRLDTISEGVSYDDFGSD